MKKYELSKKAFKIDFDRIEEGYLYDSGQICYAETANKAKVIFLSDFKYDELRLKHTDQVVNYTNIPVVRATGADIYWFEGEEKTQYDIHYILTRRERHGELDKMLQDNGISYCYIKKNGMFYRPNSAGYTEVMAKAGVYTKKEAVSHAKSCDDIKIIPINVAEHNLMIEKEINDLKGRAISY